MASKSDTTSTDSSGASADAGSAAPDEPDAKTPADSAAADDSATLQDEDEDSFDRKTPKEVVAMLDRYIVGQTDAKRAFAIAMRNRYRRHRLPDELKMETMPKNILMIGPTGVGKTEIARRISKLSNYPFVKVEATKYTEVGFYGRDVESIIRDLVEESIRVTKDAKKRKYSSKVSVAVDNVILDALVGASADARTRQTFRDQLKQGLLEDNEIEFEVPAPEVNNQNNPSQGVGAEDVYASFKKMMDMGKKIKRKLPIKDARKLIQEAENEKIAVGQDVIREAVQLAEADGIVFIDEIDKLCSHRTLGSSGGADASSEGVQRDLLPFLEGTTVNTKHGDINTEHILFVCSGAFSACKPSDLLAELQGRLPIRVELQALDEEALYRILTEPQTNLIRQQKALLATEDVTLEFTDAAIREMAKVAAELNTTVENIGARRLHTVLERIVEEVSFDAPDLAGQTITVDPVQVRERVGDLMKKTDLSKYIL